MKINEALPEASESAQQLVCLHCFRVSGKVLEFYWHRGRWQEINNLVAEPTKAGLSSAKRASGRPLSTRWGPCSRDGKGLRQGPEPSACHVLSKAGLRTLRGVVPQEEWPLCPHLLPLRPLFLPRVWGEEAGPGALR